MKEMKMMRNQMNDRVDGIINEAAALICMHFVMCVSTCVSTRVSVCVSVCMCGMCGM